MAKTAKPKEASGKDGGKTATTPKPRRAAAGNRLTKPEVMEAAALREATELMNRIGKDFDDVLKRGIQSLARKHKVTESLVYSAISHRLMTQAVEHAFSAIVAEEDLPEDLD